MGGVDGKSEQEYRNYVAGGGKLSYFDWVISGELPRDPPKPGTFQDGVYAPLKVEGSSADMAAQVTRGTYEDWKNTYFPISQQLMDESTYNNPELVRSGVKQAVGNINKSFDAAAALRDRTAAHYGVQPDAAQQTAFARTDNLQRSAAVVDAANRIRQRLSDRNKEIAIGGVPNLGGKQYGNSGGQ